MPVTRTSATARAVTAGVVMLAWIALLWLLEGIDTATGHSLDTYGVSPRDPAELADIVPSAFLHSGWEHVASNSVPLLVLGFIAALGGLGRFAAVVLVVIVTSGLGVWLTAP
ncbi:rhomboid family intramembrane serine protease, partial [Streptomyces sp. wa22]|uniref:rhomboid family intramembrane serine protease n=2 Tax=unclassified Streptomyces TaxID=2593676 RepID=UPI0011CAC7C4